MHPHTCPPSLHPWPRGVGCGHRGAGGAHLHILIPPSALILSAPHLGSVSVFGGTERTPGWDRMGMLGVPLSPPPPQLPHLRLWRKPQLSSLHCPRGF